MLLEPPAPAARVLLGRALAIFSFWSAAARRRMAVRAPPGGAGDEGRTAEAEAEGAPTGEEARGEDYSRANVSLIINAKRGDGCFQMASDAHRDTVSLPLWDVLRRRRGKGRDWDRKREWRRNEWNRKAIDSSPMCVALNGLMLVKSEMRSTAVSPYYDRDPVLSRGQVGANGLEICIAITLCRGRVSFGHAPIGNWSVRGIP